MLRKKAVAIVLVSPRVPENIGAAARAMKNFELSDLRIVAPRAYDETRAFRMARDGADILKSARFFEALPEAVADLNFIAASTARQGENRSGISADPATGARKLLECPGKAGILFGPEERGLTNRELDLAKILITIPANPEFSSLNLAQAVVIMCYELAGAEGKQWFKSMRPDTPTPASSGEIEGLFADARDFLLEIGFLNPQNPDAVLLYLRKLLHRAVPDSRDVRILRGLMRQCRWYAGEGGNNDRAGDRIGADPKH